MTTQDFVQAFDSIAKIMEENREYLIELDQRNGDGDLGISMSVGFAGVSEFAKENQDLEPARLLQRAGMTLNEKAPSSLGTILSVFLTGMAKYFRKVDELDLAELAQGMEAGLNSVMERAGSKPGEKTILDSLAPAIKTLQENAHKEPKEAFELATKAAAEGVESTKEMRSVHGRAAYYGDQSIGIIDGGAVVGKLIFEAITASI